MLGLGLELELGWGLELELEDGVGPGPWLILRLREGLAVFLEHLVAAAVYQFFPAAQHCHLYTITVWAT